MIGEAEKRERKEIDFDTFFTDKGLRSLGRMIRRISVSAVDLKTGNAIHVNPRDRYRPAITYKLVIALIICDLVEEGKLRLEDVQRFNHREDYEGGTGILQGRIKEGDPHQIKDLLRLFSRWSCKRTNVRDRIMTC